MACCESSGQKVRCHGMGVNKYCSGYSGHSRSVAGCPVHSTALVGGTIKLLRVETIKVACSC